MSTTPKTLLEEIAVQHPCRAGEFAAAYWHQEMQYLLTETALILKEQHQDLLRIIADEGLTSPKYLLHTPVTVLRRVDIGKLRQELPDVFDRVVYLRATDAERFIGRRRLYELACDAAGPERIRPAEQINLGDLERTLPTGERTSYIIATEKPGETIVVRITETG